MHSSLTDLFQDGGLGSLQWCSSRFQPQLRQRSESTRAFHGGSIVGHFHHLIVCMVKGAVA
ncbi:uncharacterized protein B0I36DRAFT_308999 [Microdochium trichocladiopsis]|uniref:Uncharacterized protein n=1 Tax=Microdochium trichocladiopsis TaxID=1682393 RepID=A0A9P8YI22_9PEZI|nr:uncharacterized protein B0I36DRAFT_308999 [Microdochium trichocladiopsis]KAH7039631.1 hypothetical protein B0I36DRAFT_308999 [Microdochium trichocladiopsis]